MRRRELITLVGGAAAWPLVGHAQPAQSGLSAARGARKVGFLYPGIMAAAVPRIAAFLEGLRERGYFDGQNMVLVPSITQSEPERLAPQVADLVVRDIAVILAVGPMAVRAVRSATTQIPIVAIDLESDPVGSGLIASLARPGGNITGLFFDFPGFGGKWLELLNEMLPGLSRVGLLWDPATGRVQLDATSEAASSRGIQAKVFEMQSPSAVEDGIRAAKEERMEGLLVLSSPLFGTNPSLVAELAAKYQLPAITLFPEFAQVGGLMAYGTNLFDLFHQAGLIVGKVLDGAPPANLPVERPSRFLLVINLKTAKALGITVSSTLLARADEVIE